MNEMLRAALAYAEQKIGVVPCRGKQPMINWKPLQHKLLTSNEIIAHFRAGRLQNIGVVCGAVSRLAVLDLDGDDAVRAFAARWPELYDGTRVVSSGGGHGEHVYFRPALMPRTVRVMGIPDVGNLELRADGCYVIAPPSIHPDTGALYTVKHDLPMLEVADLEDVRTWLCQFSAQKLRAAVSGPRDSSSGTPSAGGLRAKGLAQAALAGEVDAARSAPVGTRNTRLNLAAYSLGQLVADGLLAREIVERELLAAALAGGQPELPAWRTIQSGLAAGMKNPRSRRHG